MDMATESLVVLEVAERLDVDRVEVYHLLRTGMLDGRPDPAGDVRVTTSSVEAYEASRTSLT